MTSPDITRNSTATISSPISYPSLSPWYGLTGGRYLSSGLAPGSGKSSAGQKNREACLYAASGEGDRRRSRGWGWGEGGMGLELVMAERLRRNEDIRRKASIPRRTRITAGSVIQPRCISLNIDRMQRHAVQHSQV